MVGDLVGVGFAGGEQTLDVSIGDLVEAALEGGEEGLGVVGDLLFEVAVARFALPLADDFAEWAVANQSFDLEEVGDARLGL